MDPSVPLGSATNLHCGRANGTTGQLERAFRDEFGISGTTLQGAVRFYLDASRYAGLPISPHFSQPTRATAAKSKAPARRKSSGKPKGPSEPVTPVTQPPRSYNVALESGGTVMLSMSVDLFTLSETDRKFVFGLIDDVRAYDKLKNIVANAIHTVAAMQQISEGQPSDSKSADSQTARGED